MSVMTKRARPRTGRLMLLATGVAAIAVAGALPASPAAVSGDAPRADAVDTEGRYAVTSEAGGAVWVFEADGDLFVVGPGDLLAQGAWTVGLSDGLFDADVEVPVTGQHLGIMGATSPDGLQVALLVRASEAATPDDGVVWPALSLLHGERVGLAPAQPPDPVVAPSTSPGV
jgi:hypothetical protein